MFEVVVLSALFTFLQLISLCTYYVAVCGGGGCVCTCVCCGDGCVPRWKAICSV